MIYWFMKTISKKEKKSRKNNGLFSSSNTARQPNRSA